MPLKIEDIHPSTAEEWLLFYVLKELVSVNKNIESLKVSVDGLRHVNSTKTKK